MRKLFYTFAVIFLGVAILYYGISFLLPLALALFLWLLLSHIVLWLTKNTRLGPKLSLGVTITSYVITIVALVTGLGMGADYLQKNIESFRSTVSNSFQGYKDEFITQGFVTTEQVNNWTDTLGTLLNIENISAVLGGTVTGVTTFLLIIILSVLVLVHEKRIQVTLGRMYPEQGDELISIARNAVGNYALGLLVVMLVVFVLYLIGLYVIGIPYALLLAGLAAVATLVPTVGTLLGALFATIAAGILTGSLINALLVIAWFGSVQQIEEYFILPQVVGGRVSLNPMTTIMSVVGRGVLRGVGGLFLAIPIMGIVKQIGSIQGKHFALLMGTEDIDE